MKINAVGRWVRDQRIRSQLKSEIRRNIDVVFSQHKVGTESREAGSETIIMTRENVLLGLDTRTIISFAGKEVTLGPLNRSKAIEEGSKRTATLEDLHEAANVSWDFRDNSGVYIRRR